VLDVEKPPPIRERGPVALRHAEFRNLWFGTIVSTTGTQMTIVAIAWHVYQLTKSPVALGLIGLFKAVPGIVLGLGGGGVADAHDRRKLLLATQVALAAISGMLAVATWTGVVTPWVLYAAVALASAATAFDNPARAAIVPNLVPRERLANALSLNILAWQTAMIVGPGLAGFAIAYFDVGSVYAFDAVSFLAVLGAVYAMRPRPREDAPPKAGLEAVREGLRFVFRSRILTTTMVLDFFATFFGQATVLLPIFATDILKVGPTGLGQLYAAPAVGAVVAGVALSAWGGMRRYGVVVLVSVALYGAATVLFGASGSFPLTLLALAGTGAADAVSTVARQTIRQLVTPDSMRGRMTSINMIFFRGGPQLGELEGGLVAALAGAPLSVVIGGALVLVTAAVAALSRTLRDFEQE
jgi:MFS family permease